MYMYKAAMKHSYKNAYPKALHSTPWQQYVHQTWVIPFPRGKNFLLNCTRKTFHWTAQEQKRTSPRSTLTLIPVSLRPRHCLVPGQPENSTSLLIPIIWCQPQRSVLSLPARPPHPCLTHICLLPHNHVNKPHTVLPGREHKTQSIVGSHFGLGPSVGQALSAHRCQLLHFSSSQVALSSIRKSATSRRRSHSPQDWQLLSFQQLDKVQCDSYTLLVG